MCVFMVWCLVKHRIHLYVRYLVPERVHLIALVCLSIFSNRCSRNYFRTLKILLMSACHKTLSYQVEVDVSNRTAKYTKAII
jgi:hypothetical protein